MKDLLFYGSMLRDTGGTCTSIVFVSESRVEERVEGKVESRSRGIHINVALLSAVLTFILNQTIIVLYTKRRKSMTSENLFIFGKQVDVFVFYKTFKNTEDAYSEVMQCTYTYNRQNSSSHEKESKTLFQIKNLGGCGNVKFLANLI
jgi:hypothetical protein